MCRWRTWWRGLLPLAVVAAAAVLLARGPVQETLAHRAEAMLSDVGESWARARFEGRDAILEGEALSDEARVKVRRELDRLSGVRRVEDRTTLLPERLPFTFSAIRDGSTLRLEGYVPSNWVRARIVEAARTIAPGITVVGEDGLVKARGVPAGDFAGVVTFGLEQLAKLPAGRITLSDDSFSIEGRATDFATYDALEVTVRTDLPADFKLARFAVLPPTVTPFVWAAQREEDGVRLSGYIPLGNARRALLDAVRGAVPGAAISDQLRLADGAPSTDGWLKAASFALGQLSRLPGGRVVLSDTTIAIEGRAPDFAAYDGLTSARRSVPEGYTLTRFAVEPPMARPFVWGTLRGADGLRLIGFAPSEDAKRVLLDAVRASFPGVPVSDEMRIASGGPSADAFVAAASFGVSQLAKLRIGEVRASGTGLTISGEAQDSAAFGAVSAALAGGIPGGFTIEHADVRPPVVSPYVFGLRKDGQGLTVSGFYPARADHDALLALARTQLLGASVNDVSAIALGAPEGFARAASVALRELARLEAGEARIDDQHVRLSGSALYPAAVQAIRDALTSDLPPGFGLEISLDVAPPPPLVDRAGCQKAIADLLARGTIGFASGTAALDPVSRGLLDHIAAVVSGCPDDVIEIGAHTETLGDEHTNLALSEERARAVVDYLAAAGISPQRLVPVGYGAERPIAASEVPADQARNRRIDVLVR